MDVKLKLDETSPLIGLDEFEQTVTSNQMVQVKTECSLDESRHEIGLETLDLTVTANQMA